MTDPRRALRLLADDLGVAVSVDPRIGSEPLTIRLTAPEGRTFAGEAHELLRYDWREALEALREAEIEDCREPGCEWCASRDDDYRTDGFMLREPS